MQTQNPTFEKMLKGYIGFLEGTGKSVLTISSYKGDLKVFRRFLDKNQLKFNSLESKHFEDFHHYMKEEGLKTNTRRRKLITARALYRFALSRKKIDFSPAQFYKAPVRVEKLPWIPKKEDLDSFLELISDKHPLGRRNRIIVELLAQTALSISELCSLRWVDLVGQTIEVPGKRKRKLTISEDLEQKIKAWELECSGPCFFPGFNRHGFATDQMSTRAVEIMFAHFASQAHLPEFKPKNLRHYVILKWLASGVNEKEIQRRLGVSQAYSFNAYKKYLQLGQA